MNGNLTDVHWLLVDLCEKGGYCSAVRSPERFVELVAEGPERFAHAVLLAEGFDLLTMDKRQRRDVVNWVSERFEIWAAQERKLRSANSSADVDE